MGTGRGSPIAILAAGGILIEGGYIAVVRRCRYGKEFGLPKGKAQDGEDLVEAALREVVEETGCVAQIVSFGGTTLYRTSASLKSVTYFLMETIDRSGRTTTPIDVREVAEIEWLEPPSAHQKLSHREERDLLAAVFHLPRTDPWAR